MPEMWLQPEHLTGSVAALFLALGGFWILRKDYKAQRDEDRKDRQVEALAEREHREKLAATFESAMQMVVQKAEVTERLCEQRYEILLKETLLKKGE